MADPSASGGGWVIQPVDSISMVRKIRLSNQLHSITHQVASGRPESRWAGEPESRGAGELSDESDDGISVTADPNWYLWIYRPIIWSRLDESERGGGRGEEAVHLVVISAFSTGHVSLLSPLRESLLRPLLCLFSILFPLSVCEMSGEEYITPSRLSICGRWILWWPPLTWIYRYFLSFSLIPATPTLLADVAMSMRIN